MCPVQSRIVNIAESYALSRAGDPVYVSDLRAVARVSERTLQYAVKEVMGLTPVTYLIRVRLLRRAAVGHSPTNARLAVAGKAKSPRRVAAGPAMPGSPARASAAPAG